MCTIRFKPRSRLCHDHLTQGRTCALPLLLFEHEISGGLKIIRPSVIAILIEEWHKTVHAIASPALTADIDEERRSLVFKLIITSSARSLFLRSGLLASCTPNPLCLDSSLQLHKITCQLLEFIRLFDATDPLVGERVRGWLDL